MKTFLRRQGIVNAEAGIGNRIPGIRADGIRNNNQRSVISFENRELSLNLTKNPFG